ncbi:uncharacterized protein LOC126977457 [Leptidea sinapis]|uniref:uncharacterized protein LOC126977457 n=1 Tax=Leptidea sinapis TaxID=189913 RepID=UPI00213FA69F|nr:uncharacterized protein LOC126977457 [Leptidea sinapis]
MWRLIIIIIVDNVVSEGQFECGEHGRFEYCIDEIPGCVIGCHCHPGYYFDTESKICEPNTKLTLGSRRTFTTTEPVEIIEIGVTSPDPIENQVDEITKTADNLGDWLYNQFFKTVENQVINNTKKDDSLTRRSNLPLPEKKNKNKLSRKRRGKSKKNGKKSSLRRKLLRITENDSAFDSSSQSESDSSNSDSSESDSSEEVIHSENKHQDDKEHGHKKIVIINKKPKPQLPSFIFLPNMDTAYYPPIGLPPPPALPMYPIVPVPPVMPPVFPFYPGQLANITDCEENSGKTSSTTSTTITPTTTTSETPKTTTAKEETIATEITTTKTTYTNADDEDVSASEKNAIRAAFTKKRGKPSRIRQSMNYGAKQLKPINRNRQKISHRFQDNRQNSMPPWSKKNNKPFNDDFSNYKDAIDENHSNEVYLQHDKSNYNPQKTDVNFKYISELIHQGNLNSSDALPPIEYNPNESIEIYKPSYQHRNFKAVSNNPQTRRSFSDDTYYTNLGRQIASLIRSADTQNQQVNVELQEYDENSNVNLILNNNSPRSFWERSVRSPLKLHNRDTNKFEYLTKSNEVLFDIENRVEILASTVPTLTLQEIENVVNIVERARNKIQSEGNNSKPNATNFNIWEERAERPTSTKVNLKNNKLSDDLSAANGFHLNNYQKIIGRITPSRQNEMNSIKKLQPRTSTDLKRAEHVPQMKQQYPQQQNVQAHWTYPQTGYSLPKYSFKSDNYFRNKEIAGQEHRNHLTANPGIIIPKATYRQPSYFRLFDY